MIELFRYRNYEMITNPGPQNTFKELLQNLIIDIYQSLRSIVGNFLTDCYKMLYTSFFLQYSEQNNRLESPPSPKYSLYENKKYYATIPAFLPIKVCHVKHPASLTIQYSELISFICYVLTIKRVGYG